MSYLIRITVAGCLVLICNTVLAGELPAQLQSLLPALPLSQQPGQPVGTARIDLLLNNAISHGLIAGGVVLVGDRNGTLFERAYGKTSTDPDARPMAIDTIFDLASLTKVIATTPAILKLAEERKISLVDPVVRWFPEFSGKDKSDLLVMNLLTHTSGLDDVPLAEASPLKSAIEKAAAQKLKGEIGNRFKYADINFILLGELVRRASGIPLDAYTKANFFAQLGMKDTGFTPDGDTSLRCSATTSDGRNFFVGMPQDHEARMLGGVAGHAGLFSTVRDLARFCRMILDGGEFMGRRVLSQRAVLQMTAPYFSRDGQVVRGLGWDRSSPYSSPKGSGFSDISFGHTGYSGSSIWIDPAENLYVVLLTARLEYRNIREFNQLRSDLSTTVAELFSPQPVSGVVARSIPDIRRGNLP
jgi:CubicO group peptidase (beta-lactamase class C family)